MIPRRLRILEQTWKTVCSFGPLQLKRNTEQWHNLLQGKLCLDLKKKIFFTVRTAKLWSRPPEEVLESMRIKTWLNSALENLI